MTQIPLLVFLIYASLLSKYLHSILLIISHRIDKDLSISTHNLTRLCLLDDFTLRQCFATKKALKRNKKKNFDNLLRHKLINKKIVAATGRVIKLLTDSDFFYQT